MTTLIPARVCLQQRVFPEYRAPFFNLLAGACLQGFSLFSGTPQPDEAIQSASGLQNGNYQKGRNLHFLHGRLYFCVQQGLIAWLERWQPNVLIVEANPRYLSTPAAVGWMHARNLPVIGWGLGAPAAASLENSLRLKFLSTLDAVIAYSSAGADQYAACGVRPDRIFVAPNAVAPKPAQTPPVRPDHFKGGRPVLLFVGRLQERKNLHLLLHACAALPSALQPELLIIGDGPDREGLQALAQTTYPSARFLGAKRGVELEPYFNKADLFVLPGTGGLAVQEAMAHALPVIVGRADGTQGELVRPENGWVLSSSSSEELANLLATALGDVKKLRLMGKASFHIVKEEVNLQVMLDSFAKAIQSVL